jgi:outer membrane protein assembly factor BamB
MKNLTCVAMGALMLMAVADAADSPQFRGPNRDGKFPETGLMKAWPEGGPPIAWVAKGVGKGYASASVVGDTIYVPGTLDDNQGYVFVFDLEGTMKGKIRYGEETQDKQAPGSRSTPTIEEDRMYLISGLGVVSCIKLPEGSILWQVDTLARFNGKNIQWSIAESPLIEGNTVLCSPGGPDASVAALDKMTGETVWTSKGLSEPSAYCSPDVIVHNGRRIVVTMTAKLVVGLDAKTGEVLWTHPHETDYDIHAVTPVYADGMLYYTAGYKSGGGMLQLSEDGSSVAPKWTDKNLDCQHHGVVLLDGYIYGTAHGSGKGMVCLELESGKMMWNTREVRQGVTVFADGLFYVYEGPKRGIVHLIEASPKGYELKGAITITEGEGTDKHWAHPTIAGGRLYVRHGDALIAYDVKE